MTTIRNDLAAVPGLMLFRVNVGDGWIGHPVKKNGTSVIIGNARPFSTGVPNGFSDLIGCYRGRFVAFEIKTANGRVHPAQLSFISAVKSNGGIAGLVRCTQDALDLLEISPCK